MPKLLDKTSILKSTIPIQKFIAEQCGIYFLTTAGVITYIGQTTIGMNRIRQHFHRRSHDGKPLFDGFYILPCNVTELNEMEAEYILTLNPTHNRSIPPNQNYVSIESFCNKNKSLLRYAIMTIQKNKTPHRLFKNRIYAEPDVIKEIIESAPQRFFNVSRGRKINDITGQVFTNLTVKKFSHQDDMRHAHWKCQCNCGKQITVAAHKLKSFTITSCGCLPKP